MTPSSQSATTSTKPERAWSTPKRVVVKFGTNLLTGGKHSLDEATIRGLVAQVAEVRQRGIEVLIVTSGAVAAGREVLARTQHPERLKKDTVAYRQALAALGQAQLMRVYERLFAEHGTVVAQALISRGDIQSEALQRPAGYLNVRNTLDALLEVGAVPVINENDVVAVEELERKVYGDNDRLSAMVANAADADLLILLGEMEGLFTRDPHLDPEALVIPVIEEINEEVERIAGVSLDGRGRGGMKSKVEAAVIATASGTDVVIASGHTKRVIPRLCDGEPLGTRFVARVSKVESRKRWLLTGVTERRGSITVDAGAANALRKDGRSLLPAGITGVSGRFQRGDIVTINGPEGRVVACGLTNYDSADIEAIKGKKSADVSALLGHEYGPEVIHRNNMALV